MDHLIATGYRADHLRNCEVAFPHAATPREAAEEYAQGGDWHIAPGESLTLSIHVWPMGGDFEDHEVHEVTVTA